MTQPDESVTVTFTPRQMALWSLYSQWMGTKPGREKDELYEKLNALLDVADADPEPGTVAYREMHGEKVK